jgi:hypothetical protein
MSKINNKGVSLHEMFEARMNEQAEKIFLKNNKTMEEDFKAGYTTALNDVSEVVGKLVAALESIKTLDGKAQTFNKKYMRCASCTSVEIAMEALAEFKTPVKIEVPANSGVTEEDVKP